MTISSYPLTGQLAWQDHRIKCVITPPGTTTKGIVEYLSLFGKLYFGSVSPLYFSRLYKERLTYLQTNALASADEMDCQSVGFNLYMLRLALVTDQWRLPGLANNSITVSGNSRLWTTGMCKSQPHTYLKYFEFSTNIDQSQLIENPVEVVSTEQLHDILDINYQTKPFEDDPKIEFELTEYVDHDKSIKLRINAIYFKEDQTDRMHESVGDPYLDQFLSWRNKYLPRPTISIYTNWPDLLEDSSGIWNIKIVGDIAIIKQTIFLPGHIERAIRRIHNDALDMSPHIMHIINPVKIDLGELLFWLDSENTTYIDKNSNYIVYRRDFNYKSTFISVSDIAVE